MHEALQTEDVVVVPVRYKVHSPDDVVRLSQQFPGMVVRIEHGELIVARPDTPEADN